VSAAISQRNALLFIGDPDQQRLAVKGFRLWAETEGLLLGDG